MTRMFAWGVASAAFAIGGTLCAQGPGYYPPAGMPYGNPGPYGYPGYQQYPNGAAAPNPYANPGMGSSPYAPNGMPFGNSNPRGLPQPFPPNGMQPPSNPGMIPPPYAPNGMPYGNSNPGGVPQPYAPNGVPQGIAQGTAPMGPGGMMYGYPNPGMSPFPPGMNSGMQSFPPPPTPVRPPGGNSRMAPFFPPQPTPVPVPNGNPGGTFLPPQPTPVPGSNGNPGGTFLPPQPTPVPGSNGNPGGTFIPPQPTPMPGPSFNNPGTTPFSPPPTPVPNANPPGGAGPGNNGSQEKPGEPYMLPPAPNVDPFADLPPVTSAPDKAKLPPLAQPEQHGEVMLVSPMEDPGLPIVPVGPPEPYVLYEGARSIAAVKNDSYCIWASVDYLHWWVRHDPAPPLVTTGNPATSPANVGTLGNSDTVVLLGGGSIAPSEFSGVRANLGMWLDDEHNLGMELSGFLLGTHGRQYLLRSDAGNGNPVLAQPLIFENFNPAQYFGAFTPGAEAALPFALPGLLTGKIAVSSVLEMHGAELNLANNFVRSGGLSIDVLGGFRYLYLNDFLGFNENFTVLPNYQAATFNGAVQSPGSNFLIADSFNVNNRFYGGQVGTRINWTWRGFDFGAITKIAVGATTHTVSIDGATTLVGADGTRATLPGGILTQTSNIGRYQSTDTSIVPELTATIGYQITPRIRIMTGYTLLYWNNIMRAADQIDRRVDPNQVPSLSTTTVTPGNVPSYPGTRTFFTAQGVNVGLEIRY